VSRDPDPPPGEEPAHDVLAAEAFAVPAADPVLRRPGQLPDDPSGIAEPHDILAAEEFAMPVGKPSGATDGLPVRAAAGRWAAMGVAAIGCLVILRGLLRRR
jgi:hypothetical protein